MRTRILPRIIVLALAFVANVTVANQTARAQNPPALPFQYAVKFICGTSPTDGFQVVARGTYFTAINIHNPLVGNVSFRKKIVIATPGVDPVIRAFTNLQLPGDGALDFSCRDISSELGVPFGSFNTNQRRRFLKGFVVFESRSELDLVAVYTTSTSGLFRQQVTTTMNLERVPVRRLAQPDLIAIPDANGNFCRRDESGRLIITIQNQGLADAAASITRVDFATGENQLLPTPAIPAGQSVVVFATFPATCFRPDCTFRIAVDSTGFVAESNEFNNATGGTCRG